MERASDFFAISSSLHVAYCRREYPSRTDLDTNSVACGEQQRSNATVTRLPWGNARKLHSGGYHILASCFRGLSNFSFRTSG